MVFWMVLTAGVLGVVFGYLLGAREQQQRGVDVTIVAFALAAAKLDMVAEFKKIFENIPNVKRSEIRETADILVKGRESADSSE